MARKSIYGHVRHDCADQERSAIKHGQKGCVIKNSKIL